MMRKCSQFFTSRRALSELLLSRKASNVDNAFWSQSFTSQAGSSSARPDFASDGNNSGKVFVDYTVFKGKAALSMSPVLPKFSKIIAGNMEIEKEGCIKLTFFPAIAERKYDWQKKQLFVLSATELGTLISLGPADSAEFLDDPSMKSSNAGQVRKILAVKPLSNDGTSCHTSWVGDPLFNNLARSSTSVNPMRQQLEMQLSHDFVWDSR